MAKRAPRVRQREPLSKDRVLRAAVALADEAGVETLTMRKLAAALGHEVMSLYYHVANKDELLTAMADLVAGEVEPASQGVDWKDGIRRSASSFHDVLTRHAWAAALMSPRRAGSARASHMDSVLTRLREGGFSPELTDYAWHALDSHIIGSSLWHSYASEKVDQNFGRNFIEEVFAGKPPPYFLEHAQRHMTKTPRGATSTFAFGLDLLLDGLERLREAPPSHLSGRPKR